jgi:hypothetical protein
LIWLRLLQQRLILLADNNNDAGNMAYYYLVSMVPGILLTIPCTSYERVALFLLLLLLLRLAVAIVVLATFFSPKSLLTSFPCVLPSILPRSHFTISSLQFSILSPLFYPCSWLTASSISMILNLHLPKLRILIASLLQMSKVVFVIF